MEVEFGEQSLQRHHIALHGLLARLLGSHLPLNKWCLVGYLELPR
jgi:hypothetical protein